MSILAWLLLGLISGFIGSRFVNSQGAGVLTNIVVGIVGAFIGGQLFTTFGSHGVTGFNVWSIAVAAVGSIVLLSLLNFIRGRR